MNKNKALQQAKQLKETIEKAQRELKELEEVINKPESGLWKPENGQTYFAARVYSNLGYRVVDSTWKDDYVDIDR